MRVKFEATLDDFVDVNMRSLARSRVVRRWRWEGMIPAALFVGALVFAMLSVIFPQHSLTIKLVYSAVFAMVAAVVLYPTIYRNTLRIRIRKIVKEQYGPSPVAVEVELNSQGVCFYQNGIQVLYEWSNIESVQESNDSVDVLTKNGGLAAVRNRAFESSDQRKEFVDKAKEYLKQAAN